MSEDEDPLLTTAEVAALLGVGPASWRGYVSRRTAPSPDDPDLDRTPSRRSPRWRRSTVLEWAQTRRPPGRPRKAPEEGTVAGADPEGT